MKLEIPLGYSKLKEMVDKALKEKTTINSLILDEIIEKLREMGYSDDVIARIIFEDALDHQIALWIDKVRRLFKKGKVPLKLTFKISIPYKRE